MAGIDTISAQQLDEYYRQDVVFIIDLRSPKEYLECHYFGALNLPYEDFDEIENTILEHLPKEGLMILYCDRGSARLRGPVRTARRPADRRDASEIGGLRRKIHPFQHPLVVQRILSRLALVYI